MDRDDDDSDADADLDVGNCRGAEAEPGWGIVDSDGIVVETVFAQDPSIESRKKRKKKKQKQAE